MTDMWVHELSLSDYNPELKVLNMPIMVNPQRKKFYNYEKIMDLAQLYAPTFDQLICIEEFDDNYDCRYYIAKEIKHDDY